MSDLRPERAAITIALVRRSSRVVGRIEYLALFLFLICVSVLGEAQAHREVMMQFSTPRGVRMTEPPQR